MKKIFLLTFLCLFINLHCVNAQEMAPTTSQSSQTNIAASDIKDNFKSQSKNKVYDKSNPIGPVNAENTIKQIACLIQNKNYTEAAKNINELIDWLSSATENHANLYKTLKTVKDANEQAKVEKELALKYAMLRDSALYQRALILINQDKLKPAINDLVSIVRSQSTSELGFKAYSKLQEIGFTYKVIIDNNQTQEIK